jgi:AmpD protein
MKTLDRPSPNFNERPAGVVPDLIVVHGTEGTDEGDVGWCRTPRSVGIKKYGPKFEPVSYNDILLRDGTCVHLVDYTKRAWHAGVSSWKGRNGCNDFAIGVALSLRKGEKPTDAQYKSLAEYLTARMKEFGIPMERVVGHYHVSPGRKFDPWPPFDWARVWEEMR